MPLCEVASVSQRDGALRHDTLDSDGGNLPKAKGKLTCPKHQRGCWWLCLRWYHSVMSCLRRSSLLSLICRALLWFSAPERRMSDGAFVKIYIFAFTIKKLICWILKLNNLNKVDILFPEGTIYKLIVNTQ